MLQETGNKDAAFGQSAMHLSRGRRRRIMAILRMAHRVLGIGHRRLGLGLGALGAMTAGAIGLPTPALAGTCVQQGSINDGDVGNVLCGPFSIAIGGGSGANAQNISVAIGDAATATGQDSIGIGRRANATGDGAVVLGSDADATAANAVAVGQLAQATGGGSVAVGQSATASAGNDTAVGLSATASGGSSQAFGALSTASGQFSTAFGADSTASGYNAMALGAGATATQVDATAVGAFAEASGEHSTALGGLALATGKQALATGFFAEALGENATALGTNASASADRSTALGYNAHADGVESLAVGIRAQATGANSLAAGTDSVATAAGSIAQGNGAQAIGAGSVAIGQGAIAGDATDPTRINMVAIGNAALASAQNSVAIGDGSVANGPQGTALGSGAQAGTNATATGRSAVAGNSAVAYGVNANAGLRGTALGQGATASAQDSTALGSFASVTALGGMALGRQSSVTVENGVAIGFGSVASRAVVAASGDLPAGSTVVTYNTTDKTLLGAVSVGNGTDYRQITNVADGTEAQDAVTIRQLQGVASSLSATSTLYFHANSTALDALAVGADSIAVGPDTVVNGDNGIGMGNGAIVEMSAPGGTAIGHGAHVSNADGIAFGSSSLASGEQSIAIGAGANASFASSVALGGNAITLVGGRTGYTAYGLAAPQNSVGEVSVGAAGAERQITNVAAGSASTDAVNVEQLNQVAQNSAASLGGGAGYDATTGAYTGPSYTVGGTVYNNVGAALAAQDSQVTQNTTDIDILAQNITNGAVGLVQQTGGTPGNGPITIGAMTGGTSISLSGTSGDRLLSGLADGVAANDAVTVRQLAAAITTAAAGGITYDDASQTSLTFNTGGPATQLHNVAAGDVSAGSRDAVNGGQLHETNQQLVAINNGQAGAFRSNNSSGLPAPSATGDDAVAGGFGAVASGARSVALGAGASAAGRNSVALGYGSSDGGLDNVVSVGSVGGERQITNVAAGTRATDAVNLGQLNALSFDLDAVRRDADAGTASALAAAGLPQAFTPGAGMIAGAIGAWRGETAIALGLSKAFNDGHTVVKGGATFTSRSSSFGANVGVGYQF